MSFTQGTIVRVIIPDSLGGNPKSRPAVIVTATDEIDPAGEVQVAAITTDLGRARSSETVELPSLPAGHPQTKLKKPSEVVCSWVVSVPVASLNNTGGVVPPNLLTEVIARINA